jgi:hypothetical protein
MSLEPAVSTADAGVAPKKRGRPRKRATMVVNVRIPVDVYDAYCRCAHHHDAYVRSILRHILTLHAPSR